MTRNYRIIRRVTSDGDWFAIHEVYYDGDGKPRSATTEPVAAASETPEGGVEVLQQMLHDALKYPSLSYELLVAAEKGQR